MARKLKVFLSSTAQDLTAFRKAVHSRLHASPLFECIRQEDFGAHPHPAPAVCKAEVERSALFVGLIGMRRGWEPPDENPGHRSITEMEYDWAKDVVPRFMYVTREDFAVPGNLREPDVLHQRHIAFRTRITSELVVSQDGFVSGENLPTPDVLAHRVVDELTNHVLNGDLIERVRPQSTPNHEALSDAVAAKVIRALEKRGDIRRAEQGGLERDTILKLAKRLKPDETFDFDRAVAELENAITIALDVIARGRRSTNEDEFVDSVLKEVATHTQKGETERAVRALDNALKELDARETEQRDALKRSRLTFLQAGIEQDILRRDAISAARRIAQSITVEHPDDDDVRFKGLLARQVDFYVEGCDKGLNFSLEIAIEVGRHCVAIAQEQDHHGAALNNLGSALWTLGERQSGTARLDEAVMAYRDALKDRTRERVPLDWAMTQNNLGTTLAVLGERETGTARLDEAVAAYREVLKEYTRERAPLDWAMTQNNLGNALSTIGDRETGIARLDEAVTAYREALTEWVRERVPLDWATAQNNLGIALSAIGGRENDIARLGEAVTAHREALKEWTRERVPLDWATAQNNLGNALKALGEHEIGTARLDEAVAAYREALKEWTSERVPFQWALTQENLALVFVAIFRRSGDFSNIEAAQKALDGALDIYREGKAEFYIRKAERLRDTLMQAAPSRP